MYRVEQAKDYAYGVAERIKESQHRGMILLPSIAQIRLGPLISPGNVRAVPSGKTLSATGARSSEGVSPGLDFTWSKLIRTGLNVGKPISKVNASQSQ
jgi:hypothetical protein